MVEIKNIIGVVGVDKINSTFYGSLCNGPNTLRWQKIKDNIKLAPNAYRLLIGGQEVGTGEIHPGEYLAMDSGSADGAIEGREPTLDSGIV